MIEGKKLGLVGLVVAGLGAVGGLVSLSGCAAVVGGYVGHKLAKGGDERRGDEGRGNKGYVTRPHRLALVRCIDWDGSGDIDEINELLEYFDSVDDSINLDKYVLLVRFVGGSGDVTYTVIGPDGEKVGESTHRGHSYRGRNGGGICALKTSKGVYDGNAIAKLNGASKNRPGKYTIYARQDGYSDVFKKTITITRDKVELPD